MESKTPAYDSHPEETKEKDMTLPDSSLIAEAPTLPKNFEEKENWQRVIVLLEQANLETTKGKNGQIELMNCDDHQKIIKRLGKKLEDYRPDVTHQCLLSLLDSPLNKAGKLQVIIRTAKNQLIEVNPTIRIPRTYKRFAGLFAQLLTKMKIKAEGHEGSGTLLKIVKNDLVQVLPTNAKRIGTSSMAKLVDTQEYVDEISVKEEGKPIVFVVGAVSVGNPGMEIGELDDCICISEYALSAANCCSKLTTAFESEWGVH